jgi:hypothetical protein
VSALDATAEVEKPWEGWDLHFTIEQVPRSGAVVVRLHDAVAQLESALEHFNGTLLLVSHDRRLLERWRSLVGCCYPSGALRSGA